MASNTIQLKGDYIREEAQAAAGTLPGKPVKINSAGKFAIVTTEGAEFGAVAVENALQGETVDDNYAADDIMQANYQRKGNKIQMLLKAGENVSKGDSLIVAASGLLIAESSAASGTTVLQTVVAEETLDLSATGAVDTLIAVRF